MAKVSVWGMWNDLDIKARLKKEANMEEQKKCEVCGEKASLLAESLCAREHEEYHLCTSCHMVWKNEGVVPFKILRQLRQEMKDRVHYERVDELEEQIVAVRNTVSNMALNRDRHIQSVKEELQKGSKTRLDNQTEKLRQLDAKTKNHDRAIENLRDGVNLAMSTKGQQLMDRFKVEADAMSGRIKLREGDISSLKLQGEGLRRRLDGVKERLGNIEDAHHRHATVLKRLDGAIVSTKPNWQAEMQIDPEPAKEDPLKPCPFCGSVNLNEEVNRIGIPIVACGVCVSNAPRARWQIRP